MSIFLNVLYQSQGSYKILIFIGYRVALAQFELVRMQMRWFLRKYCYWAAQKTEKRRSEDHTGSEVYQIEQECIMYTYLDPP